MSIFEGSRVSEGSRTSLIAVATGLVVSAVVGCGSSAAPTKQATEASASIRAAQEVGATGVPKGSFYLQLAKENEHHARALMSKSNRDEDEMNRARHLLRRAQADAELAVALAREEQAKTEAEEATQRLRALENDAGPAQPVR